MIRKRLVSMLSAIALVLSLFTLLPEDEFIKAEAAEEYGLYVAGISVTSENCGSIYNGAAEYKPDTKTLVLKKNIKTDEGNAVLNLGVDGLKIQVLNDATLSAAGKTLFLCKNTTITGDAKLTVGSKDGAYDAIVVGDQNNSNAALTILNCSVSVTGKNGIIGNSSCTSPKLIINNSDIDVQASEDGVSVGGFKGGITLTDCSVTAPKNAKTENGSISSADGDLSAAVKTERANPLEKYELYLCGIQVTNTNCDDILGGGEASYDNETKTLTLKKDIIFNKHAKLTNKIDGLIINTVADITFDGSSVSDVFSLSASVTFTGNGKLNIIGDSYGSHGNYAFGFRKNPTITIKDTDFTLNTAYGFGGISGSVAKLIVDNSNVYLKATSFNTTDFKAGIELNDCVITNPKEYVIEDGVIKTEYQGKLVRAGTVEITRQETPKSVVSFDPNGGTGTMDSVKKPIGTVYSIPACTFTPPENYEFDHWTDGTNDYEPGDIVTLNADLSLKAVWKLLKFTVTLDSGTGTTKTETVLGRAYTVPECTFKPAILTAFDHWSDGTDNYKPGDVLTLRKDITLTAVWRKYWLVKFDANGGSGTMNAVKVDRGSEYTIPKNSFTAPANMYFTCWTDGTNTYYPGEKMTVNNTITLKPVWKGDICTVTLKPNGSPSAQTTINAEYGANFELPSCIFDAPSNTRFIGWEGSDGKIYSAHRAVKASSMNMTFKAVWGYGIIFNNSTELTTDKNYYMKDDFAAVYMDSEDALLISGNASSIQITSNHISGLRIIAVKDTVLKSTGNVLTLYRDTTITTLAGKKLTIEGGTGIWVDNSGDNGVALTFENADDITINGKTGYGIFVGSKSPALTFTNSNVTINSQKGAVYRAGTSTDVLLSRCRITSPESGSYLKADGKPEENIIIEKVAYLIGDVNHDGSVDRIDANLLSRYVAGWDGYEEKIFKDCADLNGDTEINRIDANILSRCVADWDGYRAQYIK